MTQPSGERPRSLAAFSFDAIRVSMLDDDAARKKGLRNVGGEQLAPMRVPPQ
jgi:hypothetical protein